MRRRDFLSLFLLAPATALAEEGLLIDMGTPQVATGMLADAEGASGMLLDIPKEVVESQAKIRVHLYSPKTWNCPHCDKAHEALKDHPGVDLVPHKSDELPSYFTGKGFPVLHWGSGDKWQIGWENKEKFLAKLLEDTSTPPAKRPVTVQVKDSGGSHWSVEGDWSPSRSKAINHLVNTHGFPRERVEALNIGQLLTLHDMAHEGRKSQAIKSVSQVTAKVDDCPS